MEGAGYDVVGDLHGHAGQLHRLLAKLGYLKDSSGESYLHPEGRQVIFLGDFINRGPEVDEVLRLAQAMHQSGSALAVLGNHEFGVFTRMASGRADCPPECLPYVDWLRTLPLALEVGGLRVIHAAWHRKSLEVVGGRNCEDEEFVRLAGTKGTPEHKATKILLRGVKVPLPTDKVYRDRFEIPRDRGRIRWWLDPEGVSYAGLIFPACEGLPDDYGPKSSDLKGVEPYPVEEPPVFLGHYCLPPAEPKVMDNVACVDGCVTCDKVLWAYRYDGERTLSAARLASSS